MFNFTKCVRTRRAKVQRKRCKTRKTRTKMSFAAAFALPWRGEPASIKKGGRAIALESCQQSGQLSHKKKAADQL